MGIIKFLNLESLKLPIAWDQSTEYFDRQLRMVFNNYLTDLGKIGDEDYLSNEIHINKKITKNLCDKIIEILELHFRGFPGKAFEIFKSILDDANISGHIEAMNYLRMLSLPVANMYRMRRGTLYQMSRGDIFHIPFKDRHKVDTQRYSIPGLPCLYLGGSTYVCWEELGRPDFHSIHIAMFKFIDNQKIKILDFGYRPVEIAALIKGDESSFTENNGKSRFVIAMAVLWPLLAACSFKVRYKKDPFKPEYVLSQLLLQWITDAEKWDGIRYFSTQVSENIQLNPPVSTMAISNFAFPTRKNTKRIEGDYCKRLRDLFLWTEPLCWQLARADNSRMAVASPFRNFEMKMGGDRFVDYGYTEFCLMQDCLSAINCRKM